MNEEETAAVITAQRLILYHMFIHSIKTDRQEAQKVVERLRSSVDIPLGPEVQFRNSRSAVTLYKAELQRFILALEAIFAADPYTEP